MPDGTKSYGVKLSGVPFGDGDKAFVWQKMSDKVGMIVRQINKLNFNSAPAHLCLVRTSTPYWCSAWTPRYNSGCNACDQPEVLIPHLRRLDSEILQVARIATGQPFAKENELATIIRLRWTRRLLGGMIRSASDVAPAIYLEWICLSVSSFTAWTDSSDRHVVSRTVGSYICKTDSTKTVLTPAKKQRGSALCRTLIASGYTLGNDLKARAVCAIATWGPRPHQQGQPACVISVRFVTVPKDRGW